jgi:hypothetical protein
MRKNDKSAEHEFSFCSLFVACQIKRQQELLNTIPLERSNIMAKYDDYDWDELPSEIKAAGKVYLLLVTYNRSVDCALTKTSKWNIV